MFMPYLSQHRSAMDNASTLGGARTLDSASTMNSDPHSQFEAVGKALRRCRQRSHSQHAV